MKNKTYTGINIQWPISELILSGKKTIETRTYPIPEKYLNQEMLMIETPGKHGKFKSRIVAIIKFTKCIKYKTKKDFYNDINKHCVTKDSIWAWKDGEKWGWQVEIKETVTPSKLVEKTKGIIYTSNLSI
jgi:hypothetical protein